MTRFSYRAIAWAAIPLVFWVPTPAWRQESERAIAAALYAPGFVGGHPVSAAGFESLHGELMESARLGAEGGTK